MPWTLREERLGAKASERGRSLARRRLSSIRSQGFHSNGALGACAKPWIPEGTGQGIRVGKEGPESQARGRGDGVSYRRRRAMAAVLRVTPGFKFLIKGREALSGERACSTETRRRRTAPRNPCDFTNQCHPNNEMNFVETVALSSSAPM